MQELLTPQEVAQHLKVETKTVYEYIADGCFPNVLKIKGQYRIPLVDLDRYKDQCRVFERDHLGKPSLPRRRVISGGV